MNKKLAVVMFIVIVGIIAVSQRSNIVSRLMERGLGSTNQC